MPVILEMIIAAAIIFFGLPRFFNWYAVQSGELQTLIMVCFLYVLFIMPWGGGDDGPDGWA